MHDAAPQRRAGPRSARRLAIVGGGWAGLAALVQALDRGHSVTLFEMAPQLGGRARAVEVDGVVLDNGQHILIGAYRDTLALMRRVGADPHALLARLPLTLVYPDGSGLRLTAGAPVPAFVRAALSARGWGWRDRLALMGVAGRWAAQGFRAAPGTTVAELARSLPPRVQRDLVEPLCVAALNTPAERASAAVFLRVLRDALFGGTGSADLLLPRASLSALLPDPAAAWAAAAGARLRLGKRVQALVPTAGGWQVDGESFDAVLLACSAQEAARLAQPVASDWAEQAAAFGYEPIVTVWLRSDASRLAHPMLALHADQSQAPAQFVFDLGALGGPAGVFAFVVSGARGWLDRIGLAGIASAVRAQAGRELAAAWRTPPSVLHMAAERRATFACTPGLRRPGGAIAPGLAAAGDYIDGPYPATLEGAVRSAAPALAAALDSAWQG